jgi:hypothetical protein
MAALSWVSTSALRSSSFSISPGEFKKILNFDLHQKFGFCSGGSIIGTHQRLHITTLELPNFLARLPTDIPSFCVTLIKKKLKLNFITVPVTFFLLF